MKRAVRLSVGAGGELLWEDPSPWDALVARRLGLPFAGNPPKGCLVPERAGWWSLKTMMVAVPEAGTANMETLWAIHDEAMETTVQANKSPVEAKTFVTQRTISLLDLKRRIARQMFQQCRLCPLRCGGQLDCPAAGQAQYHQHFVHLGEEREIGQTLALEMAGCNMHCRFCQKGGTLLTGGAYHRLSQALWQDILAYGQDAFHSLSLVGGNPDQSLPGILDFLAEAPPESAQWPIIWHTNGYVDPPVYDLLAGIVDVWVFDFKFFHDDCASQWSRAVRYVDAACRGLTGILESQRQVPVIVRHLLLPGHESCCAKPLIDYVGAWARRHGGHRLWLHLMDQYVPAWRIGSGDGRMQEVIDDRVVKSMRQRAREQGLRLAGEAKPDAEHPEWWLWR
ncbi:radical SAM protein [Heliophilum fasciatum]|uniref:Putative Fe-S radical SAM superfamily protein PflX n=1 Tax=Heliophilum fasciatum TaxID=35700 RepID=A0A4R2RD41_9FIRM|nr:radical SAM protein [Heliophilum fasciatum]MCW2279365.1 putative Fe-S radical SAM superfamily protein PflX [Heliophilum fasciatum]TCP60208.1 putative Fe-S radical SAM superfamily protein PflX [Heliophilum fasciatum]